jgi:hypothetical protein
MLLRYTITLCHYITLPPLINNSTRAVKRHESKMKDSAVPLELRRNLGPRRHHHALLHGLTRALARQPESVTKPMPGPANRLLPCVPPARAGQVRGNKRVVTRPHAAAPPPAPASRRRRHAQPGRVRRCFSRRPFVAGVFDSARLCFDTPGACTHEKATALPCLDNTAPSFMPSST